MDVGNFGNPLGTLQVVSILSCMRSLSDVLNQENCLKGTDQNKPIPIVNAIYHYLLDENEHNQLDFNERKLHLAEKTGDSCKLNGVKNVDVITKTLNSVINSLVFEKYGSIDGFIAYTLLSSSDYSNPLPQLLKEALRTMNFKNDNGENSVLDSLAVDNIFQDLIKPLLPHGNTYSKKTSSAKSHENLRNKRSPLTRNLVSRAKSLSSAVTFGLKNSKLKEVEILNELKKYDFQEPKETEINFVKEWMVTKGQKIPTWAENLKIDSSDAFYKLKYLEVMDKSDLTIDEAMRRIDTLYPIKSHPDIRKILPVDQVLKHFKQFKAYNEMRFEDYYALRWYGDDGYKKMGQQSDEERRMKNAIYRLAIRQFENPKEVYDRKLFRGESRIPAEIEKELKAENKEFQFTRFTSTSTDEATSKTYSLKGPASQTKVMYEMTFAEPIIRAKADHLLIKVENERLLLPGTKFHIDEIKTYPGVSETGEKLNCITVKMTASNKVSILERQKNIMSDISKLEKSGTVFYV